MIMNDTICTVMVNDTVYYVSWLAGDRVKLCERITSWLGISLYDGMIRFMITSERRSIMSNPITVG